jgi:hypothetical protein
MVMTKLEELVDHSHGDTHTIRNILCLLIIIHRKQLSTYIQITVIVNEKDLININMYLMSLLGMDIVILIFVVISKDFMSVLIPLEYYEIYFFPLILITESCVSDLVTSSAVIQMTYTQLNGYQWFFQNK